MRLSALLLSAALSIGGGADLGARGSSPAAESPPFHFVDIAEISGIRAPTWYGRPHKPHLLESTGTGLALFDYDGDADLDLFVVNGWRLQGTEVAERGADDIDSDGDLDLFVTNFGSDLLYRNNGDGTFTLVPDGPGVDGWSAAAVFFDADRDGDSDLYVTAYVESTLDEMLFAEPELYWQSTQVMRGLWTPASACGC